ncbi:response regulator transcription factor [Synechococcus sp. HK01-R]|uniref:response regulator transcription factor n=1 Tax=Synechococcus sp. HK01-R TaxID=2751171 RepID=UPI0016245B97|nr:response regulator transcription factor [Synechococcus sp. HK01-R]QNG27080.1 response regulator transcription factor [Synechococcus sp. HK01-R]
MSDQESAPLLLVDDDPELLQLLFDELQGAGHRCVGVNNGQDALMHLRRGHFALVVLDWTLPDFSGVEICRRLRSSGNTTPVLMVTARDALEERVAALDAGADDYLTKPFELDELQARVRAQLRRRDYASGQEATARLELGDLSIDLILRRVLRAEREINLSQREFDLLVCLVKHPEQVLEREQILELVWGKPFVGDPNTLDVYMGYLRRKLEKPGLAQLLHTVRGVGFMARLGEVKA